MEYLCPPKIHMLKPDKDLGVTNTCPSPPSGLWPVVCPAAPGQCRPGQRANSSAIQNHPPPTPSSPFRGHGGSGKVAGSPSPRTVSCLASRWPALCPQGSRVPRPSRLPQARLASLASASDGTALFPSGITTRAGSAFPALHVSVHFAAAAFAFRALTKDVTWNSSPCPQGSLDSPRTGLLTAFPARSSELKRCAARWAPVCVVGKMLPPLAPAHLQL